MAKRQLDGSRVIVTGASSGIGRQLALQFAGRGSCVIAAARRETLLDELASDPVGNHRITPLVVDLTIANDRRRLVEFCRGQWGGLDVLVNNAGITAMGEFATAQPERLREIFEVNFFAVAELIRDFIPLLEQGRQPIIVNVSSVLAHRAVPLKSEYCASKFAIHGFSDAIRGELAERGIDVLLASPSTTDSQLFDAAIEDGTGIDWKQRGSMAPLTVAQKIVRATERGKHEVILSAGGKLLVWLDRLFPTLADKIVARHAK